jgi:hypothetical protein
MQKEGQKFTNAKTNDSTDEEKILNFKDKQVEKDLIKGRELILNIGRGMFKEEEH